MKYQIAALSTRLFLVTGCSDKPSQSEEPKAPETTPATEPPNGESFSVSELNLDMLWCKPGTFLMGSSEHEKDRRDNETQHEVTLAQGFYLGKHEVSQEQWERTPVSSRGQLSLWRKSHGAMPWNSARN